MKILNEGFEAQVRALLGVDEYDLPDKDINSPFIARIAEEYVISIVPDYSLITDDTELLFLQYAVINYICYLICPSMPQRLNIEVQAIDTKWKKARTDWEKKALEFYDNVLKSLDNIYSVPVNEEVPVTVFSIASRGIREPIGGAG